MLDAFVSAKSGRGNYGMSEFKWDDDVRKGHIASVAKMLGAQGERQINMSDRYYSYGDTLHQFALMSGLGNQTVTDWHKPALVRFRREPRQVATENSPVSTRQRLAIANDYFHRKATEVFNDKSALQLLEKMRRDVVWDIADFDACQYGITLAKLTAANFAEVGAKVIYITEAGQRFMKSVKEHETNFCE